MLGANDGIGSTASLVVGVAAAEAACQDVLVAGVAGLGPGALSMAAGECVSVRSQADTVKAEARVTIWGMLAMLATAAVGRLFGTTVA